MSNKTVHVACLLNPSIGVINQMTWEAEAAKTKALNFESIIFTTAVYQKYPVCKTYQTLRNPVLAYLYLRIRFTLWLFRNRKKYKRIILRYSAHDPSQIIASFFLRRYFTVHHTFEIEEIQMSRSFKSLKLAIEQLASRWVLNKAEGIIGVTQEICKYEVKRLKAPKSYYIYPNGIQSDFIALDPVKHETLHCVFISSLFQPWTGIDYLVNDYLENGDYDMKIHLIGRMPTMLRQKLEGSSLFIMHGEMATEQINEVYNHCHLAISSLGFEKKLMQEACPLKSREYLSAGLPVVGGYIDAALPKDFPYYKRILPSLAAIYEFAVLCGNYTRKEVREAALPYINKNILLERLVTSLDEPSQNI